MYNEKIKQLETAVCALASLLLEKDPGNKLVPRILENNDLEEELDIYECEYCV